MVGLGTLVNGLADLWCTCKVDFQRILNLKFTVFSIKKSKARTVFKIKTVSVKAELFLNQINT